MQKSPALKRYFVALTLVMILNGCTHTKFTGANWQMDRMTLLQKAEIQTASVSTNGTATLGGYTNDGGQAITLQILQTLLNAALRSAPVP